MCDIIGTTKMKGQNIVFLKLSFKTNFLEIELLLHKDYNFQLKI